MRRHVIGAFLGMGIERVALGYQPIEPAFEICPRRRIGIFLQQQACRRMPNEQCD
jgi:hypothetical protein